MVSAAAMPIKFPTTPTALANPFGDYSTAFDWNPLLKIAVDERKKSN